MSVAVVSSVSSVYSISSAEGRVGVLMGGLSAEREISLKSGAAVLNALQSRGVDAIGIDLTDNWAASILAADIQTAFITLHGTLGEDGCVQGLLETMAMPYTGSGVTASALCMDKLLCKQVLQAAGLKTPIDIAIAADGPIRYPVFIKPVSEGSSIGLHHLKSVSDWTALNLDDATQWMAELPVKGVEIAVSVLNGKALMPVEVAETLAYCMQRAEQAVTATGCTGAPRVDMIVDSGGEPLILEINTIPGMTETSLLPKAAAAAGIDFGSLCLSMIEHAGLEHSRCERDPAMNRAGGGA